MEKGNDFSVDFARALEIPPRPRYILNGRGLPSVTDIIKDLGFVYLAAQEYLDRGRAVHAATHYLDEGDLRWDDRIKPIEGYLRAWEKFKADTKIKILKIEISAYHPLYLYAGTLDRLVEWNRYEWVLDIKSGPAPAWGGYQTGGYDLLLPPAGKIRKRGCVELRADGSYNFAPHQDPDDGAIFLSMLTTYNARRRHGARSFGRYDGNISKGGSGGSPDGGQ